MKKLILLCVCFCATTLFVPAEPARAAGPNYLSYVSNTGSNGNDCSTPVKACATFPWALSQTADGGEIDCVNTGEYTADFTISQSLTIDCTGSVVWTQGQLTVNGAGIVVRLRNLSFNYFGLGGFGIDGQNMAALYVENCVITNFNNAQGRSFGPFIGIQFEPSAGEALLSVTNTVISNNGNVGGSTGGGIEIAPTSGATASVTLDGVKLLGNVYGIGLTSAGGTIVGALRHSVIAGSNVSGLVAAGGGSAIFWTVDGSTIMNNSSYGIQSLGTGVNLQIGNSTITGNGTGVSGPGIVSFKNNQISGNAINGTPLAAVSGGLQ